MRNLLAGESAHRAAASTTPSIRAQTKSLHIEVCLDDAVCYRKSTGFETYDFGNEALTDLALTALDTSARLLDKPLRAPLMIAPMTGGTPQGAAINRILASTAQRFGLAMGVGSQRIALDDAEAAIGFKVRDVAPDIVLFANFGAGQLARGWNATHARRAVEMVGADAIFVHFNAVQEAIQGGDHDFRDLTAALRRFCRDLAGDGIPVFAREVCFGLSVEAARRLIDCGVRGIDCSGAGGTSWAKVEALCARSERRKAMGMRFGEWGIPTARSILNVRAASHDIPLIASGGLRDGVDLAKALALGADIGAMARAMLLRAVQGVEALEAFIEDVLHDLRVCMFASGAGSIAALRGRLHPGGVSA